ncbi:uncharacterized protein [Linepithema humile]|uniref:uncharacterized protein n=1 Tax=Linepithema humile TaxID=83485 RepID=UPI00351F2902
MSEALVKQLSLLRLISRSLDNFKKIGKNNYNAAKIRARISALKETWAQCLQTHAAIVLSTPEIKRSELDYFKNQMFDEYYDIYQTTLEYITECLKDIEPVVAPEAAGHGNKQCESSLSLSHLPPINIPPFSEKFEDWESFRDRFTSLIIANRDLSAFARMHFLTSSLTGRALESLKSIPVTADNFDIAWQTLVSRYENKRRLIEIHVSALHNLPSVSRKNAFELTDLRDKANRAIASLRNMHRLSEEILSDMLVHCLTQKLDPATRKAWKLKEGDDREIPTYEDLDKFIAFRSRALEELTSPHAVKSSRSPKVLSATTSATLPTACPLCKESHFINKCPQFIKKSPSQRLETIKQAKRCINCLSAKHATPACPSKYSCRTCQAKHHSMLHSDSTASPIPKAAPTSATSPIEKIEPAPVNALFSTLRITSRPSVLLATARVRIGSPSGRYLVVRALLDQGSEVTFITERLVQSLRLRRIKTPISISAVGCVNAGTCRYAVNIQLCPCDSIRPVLMSTAFVLRSLTNYSPAPVSPEVHWSHLADLKLADPDPVNADLIDVIIGADLFSDLLLDGIRKGEQGQPIAQNTIFGWVISGPTSTKSVSRKFTVQHCSSSLTLDQELRKFWEVEEIPRQISLSPEEQQCKEHFRAMHSRNSDGRYIVRLPFKKGPPIAIGKSRNTAACLLRSLRRRLSTNLGLKEAYFEFLREYEELGHMRKVTTASAPSCQHVYIPHHPIIRESSSTTRLRVVFNASSRTSNNTSLNDHLLTGPKLQADLAAVILRWRQCRYVYSADIAKMYRQILVDPRDVDHQRIIWTDSSNECDQEFQLLTVTYGTASAPFLALRVLQQLVRDEGHEFPLAVQVLQDNTYVDDVLFGADDIPLLRQIRDQVCAVLSRGKFDLRKWSSNSYKLLSDIAEENHGLACSKTLQTDEQLKILGISWNPTLDAFQFNVSLPASIPKTKRTILSTIAKIFDPLGWSAPVTIAAKIFLQHLWQQKVDWDEAIPPALASQWETIQSSLNDINGLQLERWIQRGADTTHCEIHGFADASNAAYAAAVYIRLISLSGYVTVRLLVAKSKVAPVKTLSIPRLELSAAVLLSRLVEFVRSSLYLGTVPCHCWTDSTVVLAWINQHPFKWKTFVSNRVSEVQSRLPSASWRHVPTADNPADCASRGISGNLLLSHHLWWQGPAWLRLAGAD